MCLSTMGFICMGLGSLTGWEGFLKSLDVHFADRLDEYLTSNLRHIDVERITDMAKYVTSYAMKGLKRSTFTPDQRAGVAKDGGGIAGPKPPVAWMG